MTERKDFKSGKQEAPKYTRTDENAGESGGGKTEAAHTCKRGKAQGKFESRYVFKNDKAGASIKDESKQALICKACTAQACHSAKSANGSAQKGRTTNTKETERCG